MYVCVCVGGEGTRPSARPPPVYFRPQRTACLLLLSVPIAAESILQKMPAYPRESSAFRRLCGSKRRAEERTDRVEWSEQEGAEAEAEAEAEDEVWLPGCDERRLYWKASSQRRRKRPRHHGMRRAAPLEFSDQPWLRTDCMLWFRRVHPEWSHLTEHEWYSLCWSAEEFVVRYALPLNQTTECGCFSSDPGDRGTAVRLIDVLRTVAATLLDGTTYMRLRERPVDLFRAAALAADLPVTRRTLHLLPDGRLLLQPHGRLGGLWLGGEKATPQAGVGGSTTGRVRAWPVAPAAGAESADQSLGREVRVEVTGGLSPAAWMTHGDLSFRLPHLSTAFSLTVLAPVHCQAAGIGVCR